MSLLRETFGLPSASASALSDLQNPRAWLSDAMGGRPTTAGETVNGDTALTVSAFFAALRNISEDVGGMPVKVFEKLPNKRRRMREDHAAYRLLNEQANPYMSAQAVRQTLIHFALGWGGGIAEIVRDSAGHPLEYWPIHADRVTTEWRRNALWYKVALAGTGADNDHDKAMMLPARDVFHVHGLGPTGVGGYSLLQIAAESLGLSLAGQRFGAALFGNGTNMGTVLAHPDSLDARQRQNLRESMEQYRGAANAGKMLVLEGGTKVAKLGIPPEEAQMLETRQFQVVEAARWLRMPPHKLQAMERATLNNIEHQGIEYVVDALDPWGGRVEREAKRKLIGPGPVHCKHNFDSRLRGDTKARGEHYRSLFHVGGLTPNEIREKEDMEPSDDEAMDRHYVQGAMVPIEDAGRQEQATAPPPTEPDESTEPDEKPEDDQAKAVAPADRYREQAATCRPLLLDAAHRCVRRETSAVEGPSERLAHDPKAFVAWANGFYAHQRKYIANAFAPVMGVLEEIAARDGLLFTRTEQRTTAHLDGWQSDALKSVLANYHQGHAHQTLLDSEPERAAEMADDFMRLALSAATETDDG